MNLSKKIVAATAAVVTACAISGVAYATTTTDTATCTPSPVITTSTSTEGFDVHCDVPLPAPVTVTVTASPSTSTSTTASPSPTSSTTTTAPASFVMPDATNTGPQGCTSFTALAATGSDSFGPIYQMAPGESLNCVSFDGSLQTADNTSVTNSKIGDVRAFTSNGVTIDHVATSWLGVGSSQNVTFEYNHISPNDDAIDVAEDHGGPDTNIKILSNFIDVPVGFDSAAHVDGLQVRGVSGLTVQGNRFAPGAYHSQFNAAVYLEDQYSGNSNVVVDHNWMSGYGYTVMLDVVTAPFSLTNNVFEVPGDGDANWGYCTNANTGLPTPETGNTDGSTGAAITPC